MRRSPRRPLILKRRKLPFHQNETPATVSQPDTPGSKETSKPAATQCFPDGIRIMNHPSMSDTQVVVIPKTADLQSVIGALTAKGKECGAQGPNKFILLSESGSRDHGPISQSTAEGVSSRSTEGHEVKAETTHSSPDGKLLTGIKQCMELLLFYFFMCVFRMISSISVEFSASFHLYPILPLLFFFFLSFFTSE